MTGFWNYLDRRIKGRETGGPPSIVDTLAPDTFYERNGIMPWFVNDKLRAYDFYRQNGIPTPEILQVYDRVENVRLSMLPENFCIKPNIMHSSAGVLPLVRVTADRYFDRLRKRIVPEATVLRELAAAYEKSNLKSHFKIIVEESLGHHSNALLVPCDYKLYTFAEGVGLILQVDRNSDKAYFSFLGGAFEPLDKGSVIDTTKSSTSYHGTPVVPPHAAEMLDCAQSVPALLGTPFISVDMYSTTKGFFVGEMTPTPGGPYYKAMFELLPAQDERLGKMWSQGDEHACKGEARSDHR